MDLPSWLGRRKDARARVCATAVVTPARGPATEHAVENLSAGGASLLGQPLVVPGEPVRVMLQSAGEPMRLDARVSRVEGGGAAPSFAIAFEGVSDRARAALEHEIFAALRCSTRQTARMLVLEPQLRRLRLLLDRLRPIGDICLPAANVNDARWYLERWNVRVGLIGSSETMALPGPIAALPRAFPDVRWRRVGPGTLLLPVEGVPVAELARAG